MAYLEASLKVPPETETSFLSLLASPLVGFFVVLPASKTLGELPSSLIVTVPAAPAPLLTPVTVPVRIWKVSEIS